MFLSNLPIARRSTQAPLQRMRRGAFATAVLTLGFLSCGDPAPEGSSPDENREGGTPDANAQGDAPLQGETALGDSSLPPSSIKHGADLVRAVVGPEGLGVATAQLRKTSVAGERISTHPNDGLPSWIPNAPYVYDDNPSNHGGIVPPGGMKIDGFEIPGGTWVAQFDDFDDAVIVSGDNDGTTAALPGIVFRGCRWRGASTAPGAINVYQKSHTRIWLLFDDAGGLGPADAQYNEIPFKITDETTDSVYYRNYLSYTTTAIQPNSRGPQIIENFIEKITYYYNGGPPPGESGGKHLNGISLNGGQTHALLLRNKVLLQNPDDGGRTVDQTDCIYFKQEPGKFLGTGTNLDGSKGYLVKDNFIGGGAYAIYAGWDASYGAPAPGSLANMVITGNRITTAWWPKGGALGPITKEPTWGADGNLKSNNTFAESGAPW